MKLTETNCTFTHEGKSFTAAGATVNDKFAWVYVSVLETRKESLLYNGKLRLNGQKIKVTDWQGNILGYGIISSHWKQYGQVFGSYNMVNVIFTIDNVNYAGRFNYDNGQLVKGKKTK